MTTGWPNTLSPHDTGPAIEDAWPTLFFGAERVAEIQRKIGTLPWAAAALRQWRREAARVLEQPPQLPIEPIGWRHDFYSPATAEHLVFDPASPHAFVDPWDQTVHREAPGRFSADPRHRAWVLLAHERTYRLMRSLGVLYAVTGEEAYARWVAAGFRGAAEMFRRTEFRDENRRSRALYFQPLYDAQVLLLLANAYDLTRTSAAFDAPAHEEIRALFESALANQIEFLEEHAAHNMTCYVAAALAAAGEVFDRRDWSALGLEHPRGGFFAMLWHGLRTDESGAADGFWFEGTQFYHLYSVCPLAALYEYARRERAARGLDPGAAVAGLTWEEVERRMAALFRAPAQMADEALRLPCLGDLGAPKVMNLALYRHLYEFAAGQLDAAAEGASFAAVLARVYASGAPRTSLAAVAYGPDSIAAGAGTRAPLSPAPAPDLAPPAAPAAGPHRGHTGADRPPVWLRASGIAVLRGAAPDTGVQLHAWLRGGTFGDGHDHPDKLSFGLHAGWGPGEVVATDLGTAGYAIEGFRRFCRSTFSHNTLLVDERDQERVRRGTMWAGEVGDNRAVAVAEDAYAGVRLERALRLRPPFLVLEDDAASDEPHRYGWALHVYGSLSVSATGAAMPPGPNGAGTAGDLPPAVPAPLGLPPLPEDGPFAWFTNRRGGITESQLCADWRVRDGLWLRLWVGAGGPFEWTVGQTPGNPIPDRRSTLFLRAPGRRRRFQAALEVHRGAPSLDAWPAHLFQSGPTNGGPPC